VPARQPFSAIRCLRRPFVTNRGPVFIASLTRGSRLIARPRQNCKLEANRSGTLRATSRPLRASESRETAAGVTEEQDRFRRRVQIGHRQDGRAVEARSIVNRVPALQSPDCTRRVDAAHSGALRKRHPRLHEDVARPVVS
jgi:hypothetical protein